MVDKDPFLAKVTQICLALPEATQKLSHGAESFFAGTARQFCAFRCNGYSDRRLDVETDWDEVAVVIEDAYRKVALKRQLKALDEVQAKGS